MAIKKQLGPGDHTFQVRAIDFAGNTGMPASFGWNFLDKTPPETSIISAVNRKGVPVVNGGSTRSNTVTFEFTGTDLNGISGFECSLDDPDPSQFAPCSSPLTFTRLGSGIHTFYVQAIDTSDNKDLTPASFTWTKG